MYFNLFGPKNFLSYIRSGVRWCTRYTSTPPNNLIKWFKVEILKSRNVIWSLFCRFMSRQRIFGMRDSQIVRWIKYHQFLTIWLYVCKCILKTSLQCLHTKNNCNLKYIKMISTSIKILAIDISNLVLTPTTRQFSILGMYSPFFTIISSLTTDAHSCTHTFRAYGIPLKRYNYLSLVLSFLHEIINLENARRPQGKCSYVPSSTIKESLTWISE